MRRLLNMPMPKDDHRPPKLESLGDGAHLKYLKLPQHISNLQPRKRITDLEQGSPTSRVMDRNQQPVRNWTREQEMGSRRVSEASSVFRAASHTSGVPVSHCFSPSGTS